MSTSRREYDSWMEFLWAVDEPVSLSEAMRRSQRSEPVRNDWAGGTYPEVRRDAEASTEVLAGIASSAGPITEYGLAPHYDVAGGEVDVGRFLEGEPESMVEYVLQPMNGAGRVLRLQADLSQSWRIPAAAIRAAGDAVVALADGLRARGVGLEILVTAQVTGATPGSRHETGIMIQRPNEPFDVSRLAFAIAHPGMTRRLLFSLLEHEPRQVREEFGASLDRGYGHPSPRRWNGIDFYVALTGAVLADDWAQDQIDGLAQH